MTKRKKDVKRREREREREGGNLETFSIRQYPHFIHHIVLLGPLTTIEVADTQSYITVLSKGRLCHSMPALTSPGGQCPCQAFEVQAPFVVNSRRHDARALQALSAPDES